MPARGVRPLAAVVGAAATLALLAGCHTPGGLDKQEVVVDFVAGATQADHTRVWQECQHLPNIDPEPLVTTSKYASTLRYNVRYRVDHASNYQLQQLYDCLAKDKSVAGTTSSGSDDES